MLSLISLMNRHEILFNKQTDSFNSNVFSDRFEQTASELTSLFIIPSINPCGLPPTVFCRQNIEINGKRSAKTKILKERNLKVEKLVYS